MSVRFVILLAAGALLLPNAFAAPAGDAVLSIELRASALVERPRIVLADVAIVSGRPAAAQLAGQSELGAAPRVGYTERLTRSQIERAVRRANPALSDIVWQGAETAAVRVKTQLVSAAAQSDAAIGAVSRQFAATHPALQLGVAVQPADLEVPAGPVELSVRPLNGHTLAARMPVWVDLLVNGAVYRSGIVKLQASVIQPAYVARRELKQGEYATAADFRVEEIDVAGAGALAVGQPLQRFRVAQNVAAGQLLRTGAVGRGDKILRGDQVRLLVKAGQISVETTAIAMAEAVPGEKLSVRPAGGSTVIAGRLSGPGTVEIE